MFLTHSRVVQVAALVIILIAIPVLVSTLGKRADRDRDHLHPSR